MAKNELDIKFYQTEASKEGVSEEDMKTLGYILNRWAKMDSRRKKEEQKRNTFDMQFDSATQPRNDGKANANMQFEQILIDTYIGSLPEGLPVKVTAKGGKVDGLELELGKYILQEFMERENSIEEINRRDNLGARYGTKIGFSGLWSEDMRVNDDEGGYMETESKMKRVTIHHIGVKTRDIRRAWFDESVKKWEDAMDCIGEEVIRMEDFRMRYLKNDKEAKDGYKYILNVHTDNSKQYDSSSNNALYYNEVRLRHYRNKLDGTYTIVANKIRPIFNGKITTKHGYLPLVPTQHYTNPESIYGIGIPERYATVKPYINNLLNSVLDGIRLNSGNLIFAGNDIVVNDEVYIYPGETNLVRVTGDATKIQPYSTNINVGQVVEILNVMQDFGIQATGLNLKSAYTSAGKTGFEVGVMKEEQNARAKSVIKNRNIGLDKMFTIMLCNILQFAPTLYAKALFNDKQLKDFKRYEIKVPGKKIVREGEDENGKIIAIQDTPGTDDYFNLKTDILLKANGLKAGIETPSTVNTLKTLERDDMQKYINSKITLFTATQDPEYLQQLKAVSKKQDELYDIDVDNIQIKSDEEINKRKIAELGNAVANFDKVGLQSGATVPGQESPMGQNALTPTNTNDVQNPMSQGIQQPSPATPTTPGGMFGA